MQLDTYITGSPLAFTSRAYGRLQGQDVFFYTSDTNELRMFVAGQSTFITLVNNVMWVDALVYQNGLYLYFISTDGFPFAMYYDQIGKPLHLPRQVVFPSQARNLSVCYQSKTTPPLFLMMVDDGTRHHLMVSETPDFAVVRSRTIGYSNLIDRAHYVCKPRIAIHPSDIQRVTVIAERTINTSGAKEVGSYVAVIPGV